jgi:hypothetical protein
VVVVKLNIESKSLFIWLNKVLGVILHLIDIGDCCCGSFDLLLKTNCFAVLGVIVVDVDVAVDVAVDVDVDVDVDVAVAFAVAVAVNVDVAVM